MINLPAHPRGERIETVVFWNWIYKDANLPAHPRGERIETERGDGHLTAIGISPRTRAGSGLKLARVD